MKQITFFAALLVAFSMNAQLLDEGFDDITTLTDYTILNVSDAPSSDIFQGDPSVFAAFDGADDNYLGMDFETTGDFRINLFIITPEVDLENGDLITFYTRTAENSQFPDRLEVRIDPDGTGIAPTESDVGSYTELLLEINPDLVIGGYPETWQQQVITVSGLPTQGISTKVALRYTLDNARPFGFNGNYIGIDRLVVEKQLSINEFSKYNFSYSVVNEEMRLNANEPFENLTIYNLLGQTVLDQKLSATNENVSINTLATGVYVAQASISGVIESFKIIKR